MKKTLSAILFLIFSTTVLASNSKIKDINIILPDRVLTLNFEAQAELLMKTPQHFLKIGNQKFPIALDEKLMVANGVFEIETYFQTQISPEKLHEFLISTSILQNTENLPVEIRVENDEIVFDGNPKGGFKIDEKKLILLLNEAILRNKKNVRVPAERIFAPVIVDPNLAKRGIKKIIAVGESNFRGSSSARRQNIIAAKELFNGRIIKKGNSFSFNKLLGDISEEKGFVRELVIKGNETEKELGGGVCQVSTTVFRAAFSGGLPIISRRNHSYAVPYYKPFGLDAAIYLGSLDFRFRNNTPGDILIQSFVEKDNLFFIFYGTDDGRKTVLNGPFISDYKKAPDAIVYETEDLPPGEISRISGAHDGFTAEWVRKIEKNGKIENETFVSTYRPWSARIFKGKDKGSNIISRR
jgi:vancomycin resistance protein YoaR